MNIGIDARYLSHGLIGGVHTYVSQLVPPLLDLAQAHEIVLYADTKRPIELAQSSLPHHVKTRLLPYTSPVSSVWNDWTMRGAISREGTDVMHFPANVGIGPSTARSVITLHDAINLLPLAEIWRGHEKKPRTLVMMSYLHLLTKTSVRRADAVITVSEHARKAIIEAGKLDPARVVAIHSAPMPDFRRIDEAHVIDDVRRRHALPTSFVLADALKNPAALVRAWRRLPEPVRANRRLVFFSRHPNPLPVVFEAVARGEAVLLHRPSREDLMALYSMADAFVFPSWIEGFGLPMLEAMVCGAPVIASDRGSIPEVAGDAAMITDAEDDAAIAARLSELLTSPEKRREWQAKGFARARRFSWRKTAEEVLETYGRVHARAFPVPVTKSHEYKRVN